MKKTILIVDDESPIREFVKAVLNETSYEFAEADTLAALRSSLSGNPADLVILDLKLSDGDSLTLLRELKRAWPASRIIIMTGYATVKAAETAYELDPSLFLQTKPLDPVMLRTLVETALSQ